RNQNRAAVAALLVGHVQRTELGNDGAGLARLQTRIENGSWWLGDETEDVEEETGERGGNACHGADARSTYPSEEFQNMPPPDYDSGEGREYPCLPLCRPTRQTLPGVR